MSIIQSEDLKIKSFQLIKILPDDSNYEEIMLFCGWSKNHIKEEFIYHSEGSPTLIGGKELCDRDGDFVIKWNNGETEIISSQDICKYFNV